MKRIDQRGQRDLRPIKISSGPNRYAEGSALIEFGHTKVLCTASVETQVPKWLQGQDRGWVTAEYGMLPRSTHERMRRDKTSTGGRAQEISRLIGRSLRSCVDLSRLKDIQITIDCDVLQADGGTRTAAITGGFVALARACCYLYEKQLVKEFPLINVVSAISVGLAEKELLLDLCYEEDSDAHADANFVINNRGGIVEVQATAEENDFSRELFDQMLDVAFAGCNELHKIQIQALADTPTSQLMGK